MHGKLSSLLWRVSGEKPEGAWTEREHSKTILYASLHTKHEPNSTALVFLQQV